VLGGDVMNLPGLTSTVDNIINNVLAAGAYTRSLFGSTRALCMG